MAREFRDITKPLAQVQAERDAAARAKAKAMMVFLAIVVLILLGIAFLAWGPGSPSYEERNSPTETTSTTVEAPPTT